MNNRWLLKTEPRTYSFAQLVREGRTVWDGVRNNLALMHLRAMRVGDRVLIYHSGAEKCVVGEARVLRGAYPDPREEDRRLVVVDVGPVAAFASPVPLAAIKADPALQELPLARMSRLSVMPVTPEQWERLAALAGRP